ncbi:hypothetical protein CHARACLAT_005812 [Characodon lateralis]|uniref:Uncharacterized protein n=1 Tax=Characodon lateralis TaxID=208331 RepID=A0ABU7DY12_9TELE|nr:hypothetical protein [Characodon lateralis]
MLEGLTGSLLAGHQRITDYQPGSVWVQGGVRTTNRDLGLDQISQKSHLERANGRKLVLLVQRKDIQSSFKKLAKTGFRAGQKNLPRRGKHSGNNVLAMHPFKLPS